MSGAGPHGPLVFGLDDGAPAGDLTGLTSADGSIDIANPGGPVPDLSVRRAYGACFLGPGAMGGVPIATWFQVPFPTTGPTDNVAHVGSDLVPAVSADYVVGFGLAAEYIPDPGSSVLRVGMTLNGAPDAGGTLIEGTESIFQLLFSGRVLTLSRSTIWTIAAGDNVQTWIFVDTGNGPLDATSINIAMRVNLA